MKRIIPFLVLGLVLAVAVVALPARAATTRCVNPGGVNSCFSTIQAAIDAADPGDTVLVGPGTYNEDVIVNKASLQLRGAGIDVSIIKGLKTGANANTLSLAASNLLVDGFTVTRDGNNATDWSTNVKDQGVIFQGTGITFQHSKVTGNRNGVYLNNVQNNTVKENIITFNRTGIQLVNNVSGSVVSGNRITNNWTLGIVFSFDTGIPSNGGITITNNEITGNWYGGIVSRFSSTTTPLNVEGNWYGTATPTFSSSNSSEPVHPIPHPVEFGGTDTNPGGAPDVVQFGTTVLDYTPYASAVATSTTASTHEIGENGTLNTILSVTGLYGVQFVVDRNASVLNFVSGTKNDAGTAPNDWVWSATSVAKNFLDGFPGAGQTSLAATLKDDVHPNSANLTAGNVATWTYQCASPGSSWLSYDLTTGTGSYLSDKDGFKILTAFVGDVITCVANSGSVDGYIKLQGRLGTSPTPAGWNGANVTLTCVSGGCAGYGPYTMTTDATGHYQLVKSGPGTGIVPGTYSATVARRAYLGATRASNVNVVAPSTTVDAVGAAPTLKGGDVDDSGEIDIVDLGNIGTVFGTAITPDTGADVNGDGFVNIFDLVLAGGNFNATTSTWP